MIYEKWLRWREHYEWHPGDRMSLRSILVYKMCKSKIKLIKYLGWKLWGD